MESWADKQLAILRPQYPGWELWTVSRLPAHKGETWCARPVGHPVATISTDSPEHLVEAIRHQEQDGQ
jgi:hypothetical protein